MPTTEPMDAHPASEWWRTVELSPAGRGGLYFIDEAAAEAFARFLVADGVAAVAIEHWRDGRWVDAVLVRSES
jgi:hypothetical protein